MGRDGGEGRREGEGEEREGGEVKSVFTTRAVEVETGNSEYYTDETVQGQDSSLRIRCLLNVDRMMLHRMSVPRSIIG